MIIDAHTHIFPDGQAAQILRNTARLFNVRTYGLATAADLLARMDQNGISHAVIHMVAPQPAQVRDTNDWLISLKQPRFIKFGTLHPEFKDFRTELSRLKDHGVMGVKFQPDVQQFSPGDRSLTYPLYEALAGQKMKVMFHVGGEPLPGPNDRSKPAMIRRIAEEFPKLIIIAAHLGGLNMWDQVLEHLVGLPNVFMESSLSYRFIQPATAQKIIRTHGAEKIFFGSDYPFGNIPEALSAAKTVDFLDKNEREAILGQNAERFFLEK